MKSRFLIQVLGFILLTILLSAALTSVSFTYTGRNVFTNMKAEEMMPRAEFIAEVSGRYQRGEMTVQEYKDLTINGNLLWDATVYVFNSNGTIFMRPNSELGIRDSQSLIEYLPKVLEGETIALPSAGSNLGIIIGVPIYGFQNYITGAVFLTKPLNEVNTALNGLNSALTISMLMAFAIMLIPAYMGSRSIIQPLRQMTQAARAMAEGDFTVRANESRKDEIGQLGQSLNFLSSRLSQTIGDLILERNRLRSILDGLYEGIVACDADGNMTHCNPAALRLFHASDEQTLQSIEPFEQVLQDMRTVTNEEELVAKELKVGEAILRVTITRLEDTGGKVAGAVTVIQDITEAERLEQTRRDYVANVSHELRTPIASIRGLADALHDGLVKKESDRMRYYGYILRESMRLSRLINDLLELSRLQSCTVALEKRRFSVDEMLIGVSERFSAIAADSGLHFRLEQDANNAYAMANEDRVEQVLVALLDNAIKYTDDGGTVTLAFRRQEDHYIVSVRNTGQVNPSDLPHLFERFYKADKAHAEQGTGLGLSIAKEVMTLMGETIWVENKDHEVVFSFTLTAADA